MNITTRLFSFLLALVMLIGSLGLVSSAAVPVSDEGISTDIMPQNTGIVAPAGYYSRVCFDGEGNQYAMDAVFPSMAAAKAAFGRDFTYGICSRPFMGVLFNAYYCFSDGTKQFFRILK